MVTIRFAFVLLLAGCAHVPGGHASRRLLWCPEVLSADKVSQNLGAGCKTVFCQQSSAVFQACMKHLAYETKASQGVMVVRVNTDMSGKPNSWCLAYANPEDTLDSYECLVDVLESRTNNLWFDPGMTNTNWFIHWYFD